MKSGLVVILDYGSQYNQLIARRIRELGVYAEVFNYDISYDEIKKINPSAIIFSGGPDSVYEENAPRVDEKILSSGIPILGICYGMQLLTHILGGKVVNDESKNEFGKTKISFTTEHPLLQDIPDNNVVWMSHYDSVAILPKNFLSIASTSKSTSIIANDEQKIYGYQFHPEVTHCDYGNKFIENFLFNISKCKKNWTMKKYLEEIIAEIRETVKDEKVILGLSGGIDSSVTAVLLHEAIGNNLQCVFVDNGLLRLNEAEKVLEYYRNNFNLNIEFVDAREKFLQQLKGIVDPEQKRKIIGHEFIEAFKTISSKFDNVKFLAQGTIYPDVIESSNTVNGPSVTIKLHHNVGGLPKKLGFDVLEPLKQLFKDEVRKIGLELGIESELINRHPFPGPGLGIRILGEVTKESCNTLRLADNIFIEELMKNNLYNEVSQAFVVLLPVHSVGVMGDLRTYEKTAVIRAVKTTDFMTADFAKLSLDFLEKVSSRITNEVRGINRVVYDISSKPPATIEWE